MSLRQGQECAHLIVNSSAGTIPVVAASPGMRVYIYAMIVTVGTPAITLTIQDTAGTPLSQAFNLAVSGAITIDIRNNQEPWWNTILGVGVQFVQSGTTPIGIDLWYTQGI